MNLSMNQTMLHVFWLVSVARSAANEVRKVIAMVAWPATVLILAFSPVNPSDL